jgi:hypothetical protein
LFGWPFAFFFLLLLLLLLAAVVEKKKRAWLSSTEHSYSYDSQDDNIGLDVPSTKDGKVGWVVVAVVP